MSGDWASEAHANEHDEERQRFEGSVGTVGAEAVPEESDADGQAGERARPVDATASDVERSPPGSPTESL